MDPLRVLVVDDEEELVQTLVERLNLRGINARGLTTGWEALNVIKDEPFDVILLDVKMPGVGGLQVLKETKRMLPDQQVVLLTGHASTQDAKEGMRLGAYDYLMKPVNIKDLVRILHKAVGRDPGGTE